MHYKHILFDLDGTLTDSHDGIVNGMQYAMEQLGHVAPEASALSWCIGPPLEANFAKLLPGADAHTIQQAVDHYHDYYDATGRFENALYPEVETVLKTCQQQGSTLYIATSKYEAHAQLILQHFHLAHYFEGIHGATNDGTRSAKVDVIAKVLASHLVDCTSAVMIGDHNVDVLGGKHFGMDTIAVTYGYGTDAELHDAQPDYVVSRPIDLLDNL